MGGEVFDDAAGKSLLADSQLLAGQDPPLRAGGAGPPYNRPWACAVSSSKKTQRNETGQRGPALQRAILRERGP